MSSVHDKLARVRKPRVHITYDVETEGAQIERELPFVVGVMGDFSGDPTEPLKPLTDRKFIQIDRDNFNDVMARMTPGLNIKVDNTLAGDGSEMAVQAEVQLAWTTSSRPRSPSRSPALQGAARDPRQAARPDDQGRPLRGAGRPARAGAAEHGQAREAVGRARPRQEGGLSHEPDPVRRRRRRHDDRSRRRPRPARPGHRRHQADRARPRRRT